MPRPPTAEARPLRTLGLPVPPPPAIRTDVVGEALGTLGLPVPHLPTAPTHLRARPRADPGPPVPRLAGPAGPHIRAVAVAVPHAAALMARRLALPVAVPGAAAHAAHRQPVPLDPPLAPELGLARLGHDLAAVRQGPVVGLEEVAVRRLQEEVGLTPVERREVGGSVAVRAEQGEPEVTAPVPRQVLRDVGQHRG